MGNKLKEITYLTIKRLKKDDIILPADYSKKFQETAQELKFDISDTNIVLKDLNQESDRVNEIVNSTNENLTNIQNSTKKAQIAVANKDEATLNTVSQELLEMRKKVNMLQKELFSDALTGAYNRKWLFTQYLQEDSFKDSGKFAFIDLNKFKDINDTYGHLIGDQVLKYLVVFLKKELNYEGVDVVRYAGDEFIVLFSSEAVKKLNIEVLLEENQKKLALRKLKSSKYDNIQFSFSYGLVDFKYGDNIEEILEKSDKSMYENKQKMR